MFFNGMCGAHDCCHEETWKENVFLHQWIKTIHPVSPYLIRMERIVTAESPWRAVRLILALSLRFMEIHSVIAHSRFFPIFRSLMAVPLDLGCTFLNSLKMTCIRRGSARAHVPLSAFGRTPSQCT